MEEAYRRLSDRELRDAQLRITDPYTQDGLVWAMPSGAQLVDIVNVYEFQRWPEEKVYCIECKGHRHKRGFTALLDCGGKALLGSKCGAELFDESWTKAEHRLRDRRRRRNLLLRLDDLLPLISAIVSGLCKWLPTTDRIDASKKRFRKTMTSAFDALESVVLRDGGRLTVFEQVRDYVAEAEASDREDELDDEGRPKQKFMWVESDVHVIMGSNYFQQLETSRSVRDTCDLLREIERAASDTEQLSTTQMRDYDRRLLDSIDRLAIVIAMYEGSLAFFDQGNLRAIASWATKTNHVRGRYTARGGRLYNEDGGAFMELPPSYAPLDTTLLRMLRTPTDYGRDVA